MRRHAAMILAAGLLMAAGPRDTPTTSDFDKIQGTWVCVSMERNGKPIPPDRYKDGRLVMEGDRFTFTVGGRVEVQGIRKLDPTRSPKAIEDTHTAGHFKGKTYLGIYQLEGDVLRTCNGSAGQERPKAFATSPGSNLLLVVYRRANP